MLNSPDDTTQVKTTAISLHKRRNGILRRLIGDKSGTSSIEFAILAIPFMVVVFASVETFVAFTGEQLLVTATETMARKVRTGEITLATTKEEDFRKAFCEEISILLTCSETEAKNPSKLFLDVRSFSDFSNIPAAIPRKAGGANADLDTTNFKFDPGGPSTVNIVRAYYRWEVITDLVRPFITNLRPAGSTMPKDYLMVATSAFRNESF